MLTLTQATAKLGVSRSTVYRLIRDKKLTPLRITPNGHYRFDPSELDRFLHECKNAA